MLQYSYNIIKNTQNRKEGCLLLHYIRMARLEIASSDADASCSTGCQHSMALLLLGYRLLNMTKNITHYICVGRLGPHHLTQTSQQHALEWTG